jgi:hypothetical protein
MVGPISQILKKLHFLILYDVILEYVCAIKYTSQHTKKMQMYSKND